ncbi:MAG: hypothetical protein L3J74_17915 [Bacteroidales bacterium]|nr:hypothetical protein [Bacteroidales bacterium]
MRKFIFACSFILFALFSFAQEQNPSSILWKSIETPHFQIIFPSEIENNAQKVANFMEIACKYDTSSLVTHPKRVSLVLNNRAMISNAYAALAPRYMQFYLKPPQTVTDLSSLDWTQLLAIHEYRHIVQYSKNKAQFTKFMTYLFGDIGQLMMQWSIPDWFFKGDAVVMETALTKGGRGRIPAFAMPIRTYALSNLNFSYDRAYLGTYRTFYPSWYHLGYHLTAYGRVHYGKYIWDNVLNRTSKFSFWPYAFSRSLKKYTGMNVKNFYNAAIYEFDSLWSIQQNKLQFTQAKTVNTTKKRSFTDYYNPQFDSEGNIIAVKKSLDEITTFYRISPSGNEEKIKVTDAGIFKVQGKYVVWARYIPDVRWGQQSFTYIVILNTENKKERTLTKKGKYLSPALSPDGSKIAAVKFDKNQKCSLVILHSGSGDELDSFQVGNNDYIRTPSWSSDGNFVVFTHAKYKGPAISILKLKDKEIFNIKAYSFENIGRPVFYKDYVLYNSNRSGIENIYAINIFTQDEFRVSSGMFGTFNPNVSENSNKMIFQDYSANGYNIAEMDLKPERWTNVAKIKNTDIKYYKTLINQEAGKNIFEDTTDFKQYPVSEKKYRSNLRLHSWGVYPLLSLLDISIMADNYLKTTSVRAGYLYNINENTHGGYLSVTYAKYFPVLSLSSLYMQNSRTYNFSDGSSEHLAWNEFSMNAGVNFPFNFSRGIYYRKLNIGFGANFKYIDNKPVRSLDETGSGTFAPLYISAKFSNTRRYAYRDIAPKYGQILALDYKQIFDYDDYNGFLFSARSAFYFPGIFHNNSIKLTAGFERQIEFDANNYQSLYYFSSKMSMPRGYDAQTLDWVYKLTGDYKFPLLYPDVSIGSLVYVKRVSAGVFYDYARGYLGQASAEFNSAGGSLSFRVNIFRIRYPIDIGVQYARLLDSGRNNFSFLLAGLPL